MKIGILGCANIARKYAIKSFQSQQNAEVAFIGSRDAAKAKTWAQDFGIKSFGTYDDLLDDKSIDAVYVPLPIGLHEEWLIKAAKAGKHIISEKSLTESFAATKEVVDICEKKNVVLYENFMCDYHPQHAKVLELIKNGEVGEPTIFRGFFGFPLMKEDNFRYNKELGGGSLNDAGAYTVFMARKIIGEEPVSVSANLHTDPKFNVDMRGSAILEFAGGKSALIAFDFNALYQNNYSVWGSKGMINVKRAYSIPPELKPEIELIKNENMKEVVSQIDIPASNHFDLIFSDFCDTVLNKEKRKEKIESIYEKILNQARVLEAIRISARENRKVQISEAK